VTTPCNHTASADGSAAQEPPTGDLDISQPVALVRREGDGTLTKNGHPICGAPRTGRSSSGPGICLNPAGFKTDHPGFGHCAYHLGNSRNHQVAAARERALAEVGTLGEPVVIDPGTALLQEVQRTAGHVAWLGKEVKGLTDLTHATGAALMHLYQRERDHLVRVAKAALDAGIAEREVRLAEAQGRLIVALIVGILGDLALSQEQYARANELVAMKLRELATSSTGDDTGGYTGA